MNYILVKGMFRMEEFCHTVCLLRGESVRSLKRKTAGRSKWFGPPQRTRSCWGVSIGSSATIALKNLVRSALNWR